VLAHAQQQSRSRQIIGVVGPLTSEPVLCGYFHQGIEGTERERRAVPAIFILSIIHYEFGRKTRKYYHETSAQAFGVEMAAELTMFPACHRNACQSDTGCL